LLGRDPPGGDSNLCDALAANPFDPQKTARGYSFLIVNADDAIQACQQAVALNPKVARFKYQLARALQKANRMNEALALYQESAAEDYPIALWNLGLLFANGLGVGKDVARAQNLYRQALDRGVVIAGHFLATSLWEQADMHEEARSIWQRASETGDPLALQRIAWVAELGRDGGEPDLGSALMHYVLATRLFEQAGDDISAAVSRARQSSLARALAPDLVAKVWNAAGAWKSKARPR
jgi:tetratricopeptide (TPR) repeat protein